MPSYRRLLHICFSMKTRREIRTADLPKSRCGRDSAGWSFSCGAFPDGAGEVYLLTGPGE